MANSRQRILVAIAVLALAALACSNTDESYTVTGEQRGNYGVQRVDGIDNRSGESVSIPKAQVGGNPQAGDCIRGTGTSYTKAPCP